MKVFFDTNVIVDGLTCRDYDYRDSRDLILKVSSGQIKGYISSKQVTDIYYILRKYVADNSNRIQVIKTIMETFEVLPFLASDINACLKTDFEDFEDAVLDMTAKVHVVPVIVTKNIRHFQKPKAVVYTPQQLNDLLNAN